VLERFDASKAWPEAEFLAPPSGDYWVLAPGSLAESRRWPAEKFLSLARTIVAKTGWKGLIVGSPSEVRLADQLCEDRSLGLLNLCGKGSPAGLAEVFGGACFTLSNDSGLAHVASLCGSPVQIVWGAGDPKVTAPVGPGKVRVLFNPVDCWPCVRNFCGRPPTTLRLECLLGVSPEAVWNELESGLLRKRGAS
jgi:ADP-heptose:LPS heptosyltransferase